MQVMGIDLHRVSLGALIIALALLVDDAMTTVDATLRGLASGQTMEQASSSAYSKLAAPMLTGTLITIAGFVPIGFAQSQAGEYTISLFQVVAIALLASWLVAVVFTPIIGRLLRAPDAGSPMASRAFSCAAIRACSSRHPGEMADDRGQHRPWWWRWSMVGSTGSSFPRPTATS